MGRSARIWGRSRRHLPSFPRMWSRRAFASCSRCKYHQLSSIQKYQISSNIHKVHTVLRWSRCSPCICSCCSCLQELRELRRQQHATLLNKCGVSRESVRACLRLSFGTGSLQGVLHAAVAAAAGISGTPLRLVCESRRQARLLCHAWLPWHVNVRPALAAPDPSQQLLGGKFQGFQCLCIVSLLGLNGQDPQNEAPPGLPKGGPASEPCA